VILRSVVEQNDRRLVKRIDDEIGIPIIVEIAAGRAAGSQRNVERLSRRRRMNHCQRRLKSDIADLQARLDTASVAPHTLPIHFGVVIKRQGGAIQYFT